MHMAAAEVCLCRTNAAIAESCRWRPSSLRHGGGTFLCMRPNRTKLTGPPPPTRAKKKPVPAVRLNAWLGRTRSPMRSRASTLFDGFPGPRCNVRSKRFFDQNHERRTACIGHVGSKYLAIVNTKDPSASVLDGHFDPERTGLAKKRDDSLGTLRKLEGGIGVCLQNSLKPLNWPHDRVEGATECCVHCSLRPAFECRLF